MKHLLTMEGVDRATLTGLLDDADEFYEVMHRPIPKVPALRGKTVATMFFEPSTRTKLSFERAAKAYQARVDAGEPGLADYYFLASLRSYLQDGVALKEIAGRAVRLAEEGRFGKELGGADQIRVSRLYGFLGRRQQ